MIQIEEILQRTAGMGAGSVLLLVGRPPVARIGRDLQPPFEEKPLTFHDTERIAESMIADTDRHALLQHGSIDLPFEIGGVSGNATIFYGMGSHNIVFHLGERPK
jgi:Tfp pilus assembly pilus retraction ATPase PilT